MRLTASKHRAQCCALALVGVFALSCGSSEVNRRYAEILEVDPFSNDNWAGDAISIYGIHVGQSRREAIEAAVPYSAGLFNFEAGSVTAMPCTSGLCAIDVKRSASFSGVTVRFTPSGEVSQISLGTIPYEMAESVKARYYERFHGSLRTLMNNYSRDSQQEILGAPSVIESSPPEDKTRSDRTYHYAVRGLTLFVQLPKGKAEQIADLSFTFCKPNRSEDSACASK